MTSVQKGNNKREKNNNLSLHLSSVNKGGNKETHTWDVSLQCDRLWTASYGVQNWAARCVPRHLAVKIITRCSQNQILASQILSKKNSGSHEILNTSCLQLPWPYLTFLIDLYDLCIHSSQLLWMQSWGAF